MGDGIVGRVGVVDKYPNVHTVYRLGVLSAGLVGEVADWEPRISEPLVLVSLGLLASRLPAAVSGGGWQAFGNVVPAAAAEEGARYVSGYVGAGGPSGRR